MLSFMRRTFVITSNRESGYGRFDIMLKPRPEHRNFPAVIIEVKAAKGEGEDLAALAAEARRQQVGLPGLGQGPPRQRLEDLL